MLGLGLGLRLGLELRLWLGSAKVEVGKIYFGGPRKSDYRFMVCGCLTSNLSKNVYII
jgi:hypothetical protein